MKPTAIREVKYIEEYKLEIIFSDYKKSVVDFKDFFRTIIILNTINIKKLKF